MKLMVSSGGAPPVELLVENNGVGWRGREEATNLEAVLAANSNLKPRELLDSLSGEGTIPFSGFRRVGADASLNGVAALVIHCHQLDSALSLWRTLGYQFSQLEHDIAHIKVRGAMPSNQLDVYFVADRCRPATGFLDRSGIVCLSLFCKNAELLRSTLEESGFFVGPAFTLDPFGRPFRMFFARNESGELYEFLSVARVIRPGVGPAC